MPSFMTFLRGGREPKTQPLNNVTNRRQLSYDNYRDIPNGSPTLSAANNSSTTQQMGPTQPLQQQLRRSTYPLLRSMSNLSLRRPRKTELDPHDTSTASVSESTRGYLDGRAFTLPGLFSLIEAILSGDDKYERIRRLSVDDAQTLIEVINETLDAPDLPPLARKKCIRLLYRTCGHHALLPRVLEVPVRYDRTNNAPYRGGHADVWKGILDNQDVAVKVIRTYSNSELRKITNMFCKEVVMWKFLQHPNVLSLIGVTMSENQFVMVSEWMENRNINEFIRAHPNADRPRLLTGVAEGLIYLHGNGMVHGDLKGVNVLIDKTGNARLADFGLLTIISDPANNLSSSLTAQGGTTRWMSPELINPEQFGLKKCRPTISSDCYALGMVIYETIGENQPFHEHPGPAVLLMVTKGKHPTRGVGFPRRLWRMLELCWRLQPNKRPSIGDVLQCLQKHSSLLDPPSPGVDGEIEVEDDWITSNTYPDAENRIGGTISGERTSTGLNFEPNTYVSPPSGVPEPSPGPSDTAHKAQALYAYTGSADDPDEISFAKDEILDILDTEGRWWQAKKSDGTVGIVPSNYLQSL